MGQVKKSRSAVIVGAGAGGVAAAARLAAAGWDVTVVEKNDFTGGRCSLIKRDGYRFDQGPSLLLLPRLFRETFEDLGTSVEEEGVHLVKCDPNYNIHFHDNVNFKMSTNLPLMKQEIERFEGIDGFERYLSFLQESHRHYEQSVIHVLKKNFYSLLSMARPSFLRYLQTLHPFESIYSRASKYFKTERLRRVFTFASMYMGESPFDAPGTYSLLQYTELVEGIWYPIGGFWKVVEALVEVGKRKGVKFRMNTPVSQIVTQGSRATGVKLASGEVIEADKVICNADLVYSYNNLLPKTSYATSLSKKAASCSSISFYWALDKQFPELSAHNIFLAEHYRESFDNIFKKHLIPDEPSFYVNVPSRVDPSAAPEGCDTIVVLVPVGHLLDHDTESHRGTQSGATQDWDAMVAIARKTILRTLEARLNISLSEHILHESVNTPPSWKEAFNLDRGAILGLGHSFWNVLSFRPKTIHPTIDGLYFVGASTHPGTGVPIVLAGAKIVTEEILKAEPGGKVPWVPNGAEVTKESESKMDRVQPMFGLFHLFIFALLMAAPMLYLKYGAASGSSKWATPQIGKDW
ncbi:phytoene desaturase [Bimuria novae-zelandiae CBS 107.79]|uniref:Phytoene desaturase n=1 Tax=Bimuria novae-zelandiae CBS 107.79 TaxID=1447943 RepID=A0A6A5V0D6_9PLEO|nr:phytoene desaturase [Bimuria novae-zelandiae CBS 107.79]